MKKSLIIIAVIIVAAIVVLACCFTYTISDGKLNIRSRWADTAEYATDVGLSADGLIFYDNGFFIDSDGVNEK